MEARKACYFERRGLFMFPSPNQTQRTFLEQECYLPILLETFLTARKAEGRAKRTLDYYREKLTVLLFRKV
jgi:hypothetical protein